MSDDTLAIIREGPDVSCAALGLIVSVNDIEQNITDECRLIDIGTDGKKRIYIENSPRSLILVGELGRTQIMNASLRQYCSMSQLYKSYAKAVQGLNEYDASNVAQEWIKRMRQVDGLAFASPNATWSAIADQIRDGLI